MSDSRFLPGAVWVGKSVFVIYTDPEDFPGKFVVREWKLQTAEPGGDSGTVVLAVLAPATTEVVADTIGDARAVIPGGMTKVDRRERDDAVIAEYWI